MAISIYQINKGINKSIEFKGLKAQYIWYMGAVMVGLIIVFSVLYFIGLNQYVCLGIIGIAGFVSVTKIFAMSRKFGEHGLMKTMAKRMVPTAVKSQAGIFNKKMKGDQLNNSVWKAKKY
ncbi:DUF4133 domain-containing protein [Sphingobacterium sp. KU25419]|nr:DUF4133 domain-containing protein [Sphingobacterium sp. KU25419]